VNLSHIPPKLELQTISKLLNQLTRNKRQIKEWDEKDKNRLGFCLLLCNSIPSDSWPIKFEIHVFALTLSFLLSCVKRRFVFILGLFLGQNDDKNVHTRLKIEFITEKDIFILLIPLLLSVERKNEKVSEGKKGTRNWFLSLPLSRWKMMIDHCAEHRIQFRRQLSNLYRYLIHFYPSTEISCNKNPILKNEDSIGIDLRATLDDWNLSNHFPSFR
jgi:hypothetical protein